jgi:hypothetical protein
MPRVQLKIGRPTLKKALEEPEKRIIIHALQSFNGNRNGRRAGHQSGDALQEDEEVRPFDRRTKLGHLSRGEPLNPPGSLTGIPPEKIGEAIAIYRAR